VRSDARARRSPAAAFGHVREGDTGAAFSDTARSSGAAATATAAAPVARAHTGPQSVPGTVPDFLTDGLDGRYQVLRKVGEGGMGVVFEARHTVIGKRVAIKVLLEKYATKPDVVARLLQEARLASSIGHENIIDITDFGETVDGRTFVVMEFLEGESLHALLSREDFLPPARALPIVRQVASALGAAHEKGVVHRDVKPENVFITRRADRDFVKVLDFGISKAVKPDDDTGSGVSPRLTTTGMILGTPLYLSPEQARGEEDLDQRIDIYALGVVLYETLTGEVPFHGSNYLSIISQILEKEARPPSELRADLGLSADLDAVVARAMAKDRRQRYQTMAELDADLARLESGLAPRARTAPPGPPPRRRWSQWAGWVGGLAGLGAALAFILPRLLGDDEPRPEPVAPPPEIVPVAMPVPQPTPLPATIHARVASVPPGAEVWWESVRKGVAPTTMELPRRDDQIELVLKLDGYNDGKAKFYASSDQDLTVTLTPKPAPARPGRRVAVKPAHAPGDRGPTSGGEIKPSPFSK
jgi:tRNA A-37 threonylcarbamoyl transferase component Bud32